LFLGEQYYKLLLVRKQLLRGQKFINFFIYEKS
jgi:hypothetical protein